MPVWGWVRVGIQCNYALFNITSIVFAAVHISTLFQAVVIKICFSMVVDDRSIGCSFTPCPLGPYFDHLLMRCIFSSLFITVRVIIVLWFVFCGVASSFLSWGGHGHRFYWRIANCSLSMSFIINNKRISWRFVLSESLSVLSFCMFRWLLRTCIVSQYLIVRFTLRLGKCLSS